MQKLTPGYKAVLELLCNPSGGSQECCGGSEEVDDALKLCRRLGYLFPDRPEALALAIVAVRRVDEKDLRKVAWLTHCQNLWT